MGGWGLRDSEGWCRYRHCRPTVVHGLIVLGEGTGLIGFVGDLDVTRCTLASASDGIRCLFQEDWRSYKAALSKNAERALGHTCLGKEATGALDDQFGWHAVSFIGYSCFRDDQYAAPRRVRYLDAMTSRPQRSIDLVEGRCARA